MVRLPNRKFRNATFLKLPFLAAIVCVACQTQAQNTPLISGGVGFFTNTNGGNTTYIPVTMPVLAAPIGPHVLVESRAVIIDSLFPRPQTGYDSSFFAGLTYLQADFVTSPHLTVVAGEFLTPFGTYNERLSPIWIGKFEDAPLIFPLGVMGTAASVGGMVRGSAISTRQVSFDYAAYYSANSTNQNFNSERSSGGRGDLYFPEAKVELGVSYGRLLHGIHQNYVGTHFWWEPGDGNFKLRSEYAHGPNSAGYWFESDYRLAHCGGAESFVGRFEPVFRFQQTFRNNPDPADGLPSADTKRGDLGFNYHLPNEVRIQSSYSRQFSSTGNRNIWQTGISYRFLFPTWKGK